MKKRNVTLTLLTVLMVAPLFKMNSIFHLLEKYQVGLTITLLLIPLTFIATAYTDYMEQKMKKVITNKEDSLDFSYYRDHMILIPMSITLMGCIATILPFYFGLSKYKTFSDCFIHEGNIYLTLTTIMCFFLLILMVLELRKKINLLKQSHNTH